MCNLFLKLCNYFLLVWVTFHRNVISSTDYKSVVMRSPFNNTYFVGEKRRTEKTLSLHIQFYFHSLYTIPRAADILVLKVYLYSLIICICNHYSSKHTIVFCKLQQLEGRTHLCKIVWTRNKEYFSKQDKKIKTHKMISTIPLMIYICINRPITYKSI